MTLLQGLYRFEKSFWSDIWFRINRSRPRLGKSFLCLLGYTSSDLKEVYEIVELDWRGVKF